MEIIIGIVIFFVIIFMFSGGEDAYSDKKSQKGKSREERVLEKNLPWLEERWAIAKQEYNSNNYKIIPEWFFDNVTDAQLSRIEHTGLSTKNKHLNKGKASDIIGLFEYPEEGSIEILKYFKVSTAGLNQSKARHEVAKLFADPNKVKSWEDRPANTMDREYFRFFGIKTPKGLSHKEAAKFIGKHSSELSEKDESLLEEWESYEIMYDELKDLDFRELYEIKSVSLSLYRSAIEELRKEGKRIVELENDIDIVINKIIELKPDIQRS